MTRYGRMRLQPSMDIRVTNQNICIKTLRATRMAQIKAWVAGRSGRGCAVYGPKDGMALPCQDPQHRAEPFL